MAHAPDKKTKVEHIRFTPKQQRMIDDRAKRCGVKKSVWMRSVLLQAATREVSDGHIRIKEPDGATT